MSAFTPATVQVRRGARGEVRVGGDRPVGLSSQSVALSGASLVVDVTKVDAVPYAIVTDPDRASWWLPFAYGDDVAAAVAAVAAADGPVELSARADSGDLAGPLLRFAVGLWLYRWWPLPDSSTAVPVLSEDDERALESELGAIAWYADEAFGGKSMAEALLEQNVDFVDAQAVAAGDGRLPAARVLALTRAVIDSVTLDDAAFTRLDNLETVLDALANPAEGAEEPASLLSRAWAWVRRMSSVQEQESAWVHMGTDRTGTATVEWGRVPPRTLSAAEDNVEWTFSSQRGHAAGSLEVRVKVHPESRSIDSPYFAAVYGSDDPVPEVVVELFEANDGDEPVLEGTAPFPRAALPRQGGDLRVVVSCEGYTSPALLGAAVATTPAERTRVADLVNRLIAENSEWSGQIALPAYDVDPRAPWFKLVPSSN